MEEYIDEEFYLEQLMDNYKNPRNLGKMDEYTYFKHHKNISCGDTFDIYIKIEDNTITDVKITGEGCAISTASMSLFSEKIKGMMLEDALKLTDKDIYKMIGIKISPGRVNCAMISLNAFKGAIENK